MKELISVIIPCYNSENYIHKCLDSIISQTYKNLEIIAVNDGSTDSTAAILERYAQADNRIAVLHQANAGAGAASNRGIETAHGDLMAFVDHDDWLEPSMYEQLTAAMTEAGADMSVCNFNLIYPDSVKERYSNTNSRDAAADIYDDVYGYFARFCACPKPNNYIWSRLYRSDIIKKSGVRLEKLSLGADTLFNFKLLPLMKRVAFIRDGLINYVQHPGSAIYTAAHRGDIAAAYADGFDRLADYYISNGFDEFLAVLPIHAFTRLRSVFFYSRLAGVSDDVIAEGVAKGFAGRKICDYLTGAI